MQETCSKQNFDAIMLQNHNLKVSKKVSNISRFQRWPIRDRDWDWDFGIFFYEIETETETLEGLFSRPRLRLRLWEVYFRDRDWDWDSGNPFHEIETETLETLFTRSRLRLRLWKSRDSSFSRWDETLVCLCIKNLLDGTKWREEYSNLKAFNMPITNNPNYSTMPFFGGKMF